ncbi:hypothetical protein R6G92_001276 [Vibrio cholerae]|uniref:hypothetical protein n=1 Tax=Vibrio TaxID=662 RepID=UPI000DE3CA27|nr:MULTISPECIES: hypothetical protein [Vibrio]EGR0490217.1 hypothetical protein [Vibrio cholerae]EGR0499528.1 hypothetical protein [Vibrio cholerae]EGR1046158.1 hypothetical protein [Vibrio cholerae]EGR2015922.1 hypothetical protein [Vibrio cholerae]EGR2444063.1 hypothetical protein [Vibrio cholerae]
MSEKVDFILPCEFTKIETYEDCPCDEDLVVWTGDSWEIEHVTMCGDTGAFYPVNGIEFTHYIRLPCGEDLNNE